MHQVWVTGPGGPEVLEVRELPDPHPGPGEVRISVHAAGVNFADILGRAGLYPDAPAPPTVLGYEVAGEIDELGNDVQGFAEGDRVLALTRFGGYSSVVVVPTHRVKVVPPGKDLQQAAGLPLTYLTAFLTLNRLGSVRSGDWILIHAVAGGVGLSALQLCKRLGAVTVGTASGVKHERLRELGLDHPVDYRDRDFEAEVMRITAGRGVDLVLDAVGGSTTRKSYRCLAPLGKLVFFGLSAGSARSRRSAWRSFPKAVATTPIFHPLQLMNANKGVLGLNVGHLWELTDTIGGALAELVRMWRDGEIDPIIDSSFPFSRTGEAHAQLEEARNFGKVLIVPDR